MFSSLVAPLRLVAALTQVWVWSPAGGYLAHSLAIMTDAAHLLTDFGSMMVSLFSLWISSRPPTRSMNFGWHRAGEADGALTPACGDSFSTLK